MAKAEGSSVVLMISTLNVLSSIKQLFLIVCIVSQNVSVYTGRLFSINITGVCG